MSASQPSVSGRLRARIEGKGATHGLSYPWWIPVFSTLGQVVCVLVALIQRDALSPPQLVALSALLVAVPPVAQLAIRPWVSLWFDSALVLSGSIWLLANPLAINGPADAAPGVMAILAAEVTASDGHRRGVTVTAASVGIITGFGIWADLPGAYVYVLEVLLGLAVGYMLRWQMRALAAERVARAGERARATLAERDRIAREIHDLVAHSLSITLLHVTGARHALGGGPASGADVQEAVDSLGEAERIGRRAMADIRRTVSVLAAEQAGPRPLPGAEDVAELVADVRAAGLEIEYAQSGELGRIGEAVGLGIYRIAQESLANVAKHSPSSQARVRLEVLPDTAYLSIHNTLTHAATALDASGLGIAGMTARAGQLGARLEAGASGDEWVVDLAVPLRSRECSLPHRRSLA